MIVDDNAKSALQDLLDFAKEDLEAAMAAPSCLVKKCKKFCSEAEAEKTAVLAKQAQQCHEALLAQRVFFFQQEMNALKNFWTYVLSQIHAPHDFWGQVSAVSLHLTYDTLWHLDLPASVTASPMPQHFHSLCAKLTETVVSARQYALEELYLRMQSDLALWQSQQIEEYYTGVSIGKSFSQMKYEFYLLYCSISHLLFTIDGLAVVPKGFGVEISFSASFDDGGLSPAHYYDNMNLLL